MTAGLSMPVPTLSLATKLRIATFFQYIFHFSNLACRMTCPLHILLSDQPVSLWVFVMASFDGVLSCTRSPVSASQNYVPRPSVYQARMVQHSDSPTKGLVQPAAPMQDFCGVREPTTKSPEIRRVADGGQARGHPPATHSSGCLLASGCISTCTNPSSSQGCISTCKNPDVHCTLRAKGYRDRVFAYFLCAIS